MKKYVKDPATTLELKTSCVKIHLLLNRHPAFFHAMYLCGFGYGG